MDSFLTTACSNGPSSRRIRSSCWPPSRHSETAKCRPLGPLRYSPSRLRAEDAIRLHGEGPGLPRFLAAFRSHSVPLGWVPADDLAKPPWNEGEETGVFAGIGRPERFVRSVEFAGASVVAQWLCGDHRVFAKDELRVAAEQARVLGADALVCTEKDAVRLPSGLETLPLPCWPLPLNWISVNRGCPRSGPPDFALEGCWEVRIRLQSPLVRGFLRPPEFG